MEHRNVSGDGGVGFVRRTDDFSEQFALEDDPRFWIRIERPFSERVVVSDLSFGNKDEYEMALALAAAFEEIEVRRVGEIVFKDVGDPLGSDAGAATLRINRMIEALIFKQRRFIIGRQFEAERDKLHLIVRFHNIE